jgi:hypothetical protein
MPESQGLNLPREMYVRLQRVVEASGGTFSSVEEYVLFVLDEVLKDTEAAQKLSPEDERDIQDRLKKLGYV